MFSYFCDMFVKRFSNCFAVSAVFETFRCWLFCFFAKCFLLFRCFTLLRIVFNRLVRERKACEISKMFYETAARSLALLFREKEIK